MLCGVSELTKQQLSCHTAMTELMVECDFAASPRSMYMLWFKFILGLKFFELVSILFAIVPEYGNEYTTKENKN